MKVKQFFDFLNAKFPVNTACSYDNVGLLIGDENQEVTKVLLALDCTLTAIDEAVKEGCQLIITHHPVIFNPIKNVLKGSVPYEVVSNNISVISMHTNLDMGKGGVNDTLCNLFSPLSVETVISEPSGFQLKKCTLSPISADDFAEKLKSKLGGMIKYTDNGRMIEKLLVCSGGGADFIEDAIKFKCDAFLTGDVKHSNFRTAELSEVCIFDAGHFNTEDIIIDTLKELLQKEFTDTKFIAYHKSAIKNR